jgi:hypothetical protein
MATTGMPGEKAGTRGKYKKTAGFRGRFLFFLCQARAAGRNPGRNTGNRPLFFLAGLVPDSARCFASRLAGVGAVTAPAAFDSFLQVATDDCFYVRHQNPSASK